MKKTIKEAVYLLLFAGIIAIIVNTASPVGIAWVGQWNPSEGVVGAKAKNDIDNSGIEINDIDIARQIHDSGQALFVDARAKGAYTEGHVKGAISLPVGEFDLKIDAFSDRYPLDQPIIIYCSGRSCEDGHRLSEKLIDFGYGKIRIMIDGFPGWQAKGFPIE